jgi:Tat protein translocase TatB subunit
MFGTLGGPELFLIFVVALIVFGPRKLPEIGKSLGKMMAEFRRASNEFRSTIESEVEAEKIRESMRIDPPKAAYPVETPVETSASPVAGEAANPPAEAAAAPAEATSPAATAPGPEAPREPVPESVSREPEPTPIEPK